MTITVADVEAVAVAFWALGGEPVDLGAARGCRRPGPDDSFLHRLRPGTVGELTATLAEAAPWCRQAVLDADTPPWVVAELVARDWRLEHQIQQVLPAGNIVAVLGAPLRPVADDDWPTIRAMLRVDHGEEDARAGREPRPEHRTDEALALRRTLAGHADLRVAQDNGGRAIGFACGWADADRGLGIVEDVFVAPEHRRRGLASALVAEAVADARARGAGPVVIAADPTDSPQRLYRRLGFLPFCVTRSAVLRA